MKRLLILSLLVVTSLALGQVWEATRDGPQQWELTDFHDTHISWHQSEAEAVEKGQVWSLDNAGANFKTKHTGTRWVFNHAHADGLLGGLDDYPNATNDPPEWSCTPAPSFTTGVASSYEFSTCVSDPEGDTLTITNETGCTLPTGVTVDDANDQLDASTGTSTGTTTGCIFGADDGTNSRVDSGSSTITIAEGSAAADYTPIFTDDMESVDTGVWYGETPPNFRSTYSTDQAHTGTTSAVLVFNDGGNFFGGWSNLSESATTGDTLWFRAFFYFPSTVSFSGGSGGDYSGWGKFMMLSPNNHNSPRMYLQIPAGNQLDYGDSGFEGTGLRIDSDGMGTTNFLSAAALPRDEWFSLQYAWKLGDGGWARIWVNETYIGQATTNSGSNVIKTWGIGDYWNGQAWIKNSSTASFYMDNVVITKEEPNTTDSGGRPFIHPDHFAD